MEALTTDYATRQRWDSGQTDWDKSQSPLQVYKTTAAGYKSSPGSQPTSHSWLLASGSAEAGLLVAPDEIAVPRPAQAYANGH